MQRIIIPPTLELSLAFPDVFFTLELISQEALIWTAPSNDKKQRIKFRFEASRIKAKMIIWSLFPNTKILIRPCCPSQSPQWLGLTCPRSGRDWLKNCLPLRKYTCVQMDLTHVAPFSCM